jgi:NAD-dependent deacetylase
MASGAVDFAWNAALDAEVGRAAERIASASRVLALTGAGLSVESGIPPFRGPGGLWTKYGEPPLDGYRRFLADPAAALRERLSPREPWAVGLRDTLAQARPNAGHRALVALEQAGLLAAVITQNIDDLHRQAGTRALLEIHGNHRLLRCTECHQRFEPDALAVDPDHLPPTCPECSGIVKGDTVHFGEPIPPDVLRRCYREVDAADCMLVIGTTATVYPAAEFPHEVMRRGGIVIEVNPYESELTPLAQVSLRGPAGAVLTRLAEHLGLEAVRKAAS